MSYLVIPNFLVCYLWQIFFFYLQVEKFLAEEVYPALKPYEEDSEAELDRVAKLDV